MSQAKIVVGVDGSRSAENALLWAAAEAGRRNAQLLIAHSGDQETADQKASARALLDNSVNRVLASGVRCGVATMVQDESAVAMLSRLAEQASLLVVGSRGVAGTCGTSLGSVAYRVASHASCPVAVINESNWTARSNDPTSDWPISIGVTSNASGTPPLEFAFAEAALRNVAVRAIHSWAELDRSELAGAALCRAGSNFRGYFEDRVAELLAPLRNRYPDVWVQPALAGDPVCSVLAEASAGSSMLVLGCRRDDDRLVSRLGPTATRLIHVACCPVVVVGHLRTPAELVGAGRVSASA
jgi:nucleotide-binding universal stress UspA family protein